MLLTIVNKHTPYQALLGRQPAILPPFEGGTTGQTDGNARLETNAKHEARTREIAACAIIEGTASKRMKRAEKSKTRN